MKSKQLIWGMIWLMMGCNSPYVLKPNGYYRIDFPKHEYRVFDQAGYPFSFEFPLYATVTKDSSFFKDDDTPYWINIEFPQYSGKIYLSYKTIGKTDLNSLVNDAYKMTYKHSSKATEIQDSVLQTPFGYGGIWFHVGGNAATAHQFYITDSTKHFLRGALYFDATPNEDSLEIVNNYLQEDMKHLIQTLRWK